MESESYINHQCNVKILAEKFEKLNCVGEFTYFRYVGWKFYEKHDIVHGVKAFVRR